MTGLFQKGAQDNVSTQQFLPMKEIKEGVVVMKDNSLRVVVFVSSMNFALKSDEEKDSMIYAYQGFLNSLRRPVQIVTRSRQLQLDDYLEKLTQIKEREDNLLIKAQIDEYVRFVDELLQSANIMEKRFFVVIPYYSVNMEKVNPAKAIFKKKEEGPTDFESQKMQLMDRVNQILSGLTSICLRCVVLNTEELIELYYDVYNPDISTSQKLSNIDNLSAPIITSEEIGPKRGPLDV